VTSHSIRILVVEDHQSFARGWWRCLSVVEGVEVVGQAADGAEAVKEFEAAIRT
jgi:DNA-binding NarL/FixJ family response regulator